ncbi:MAG: uracil-DNA glycosylase, partial [Bacteroidota bacterium]|nr:uracil-DNA glycosylase [Bacteroidota bacterium]
ELNAKYFHDLEKFVAEERENYLVYPPKEQVFSAFNLVSFEDVKVVIIGQDPYHGHGQANGLCFSVNRDIKIPPSLRNIYKEIKNDVGCEIPTHGDLSKWASQGVFLINATLTVRANKAGSHQNRGWEQFVDSVIKKISDNKKDVIFLLWGRFAREKKKMIDLSKHYVLESHHPSPLSAYRGFFGCNHFSGTNELLGRNGSKSIDWKIE